MLLLVSASGAEEDRFVGFLVLFSFAPESFFELESLGDEHDHVGALRQREAPRQACATPLTASRRRGQV